MRTIKNLLLFIPLLLFLSCQGPYHKDKKKPIKIGIAESKAVEEEDIDEAEGEGEEDEEEIDMDNKGVGPIDDVDIDDEIDQDMADSGEDLFNSTCIACHQMEGKMIGPEMKGVTERRSPEWIMNMILAPDQMLEEDPIAIKLLEEYGSPMTDMGFSEDDTRAVLEYFRAFDQ